MKRQLLIQQILSIMGITPCKLGSITNINRSTIGAWLQGTAKMGNGSVYQLYYYLNKSDDLINKMLVQEIKKIEGK